MTHDQILSIGLVLAALAIPAMVSAWVDRRPPRGAMITIVIAAGMIIYAERTKPGGYRLGDIPEAFYSVIGGLIR
ncbi:hypothetical protein [Seohaeicola zhoushanensis]|uniref:50S ribosomal protein L35 n=1 Tax=Seohaeicola zhoushanensis TaxID=1569283 RepID=A0A8J3GUM7_9RHOB|nr:hypothetical protein [Seohaeicola zhoushanensis]GHF40347.1 hypothetical protein GCM10017056_09870 [Seohaeicola zhoushanensis]